MPEPEVELAAEHPGIAGGLEIDQDLALERRGWVIERVSWALMLLVVLAALLGLFGRGVLSHASAADARGTLRVEYERFARVRAPATMRVHVAPDAARGDTVVVWLDRAYVEHVEVVRVLPDPDRVTLDGDRVEYRFAAPQRPQPVTVTLDLEPEQFGRKRAWVGLRGGDSVRIAQLIYP